MSIVTMEHVSFVVVQQEYSALLMRLMHLGCVELHTAVIEPVPPLALRSEEGELSRAQQEYQLLIQATEDLRQIGGVRAPLLQKRREVAEKRMWNEGELHKALRLAEEIRRHAEAVEHARRGLAKREELCAALIHWTPLDLPLACLLYTSPHVWIMPLWRLGWLILPTDWAGCSIIKNYRNMKRT